jgi:trk system potassium uptake protein TrkH
MSAGADRGAGARQADFHAVSAYNTAGFSQHADSLSRYVDDLVVNVVVLAHVALGGLGFVVMVNLLARYWQAQRTPLSLHTRLAISTTAVLIAAGTVLVLALEWANPRTLGALPWPARLLAALFQSITPRTAGFNTLDYTQMDQATLVVTMLLMFIGGNPGSTAGGIKTITFFVLVGSAWSLSRGRGELQVFGRRIPVETAGRAGVITLMGLMLVGTSVTLLSITESGLALLPLAFETFSAFGTVGLSMGITPDLSLPGKLIVVMLMFVGRLGPLTLGLALVEAPPERRLEYPAEDVVVG